MRVLGQIDELSQGIDILLALAKLATTIALIRYPEAQVPVYWNAFNGDDGVECFSFTVNYEVD